MLLHPIPVAGDYAAEILRPWAVCRAIHDNVADLPGTEILSHRGQGKARVNLTVREQRSRRRGLAGDPTDIVNWVEAHMRGYDRNKHMVARSQPGHPDGFTFEIGNPSDAFVSEQLEAADMHAAKDRDCPAAIDHRYPLRGEMT